MNCIIVDDEPASREVLEKYVADCTELDLKAICKNAFEANSILANEDIHLMFLDINMPKLSGINFYKSLSNPPFVIFTTAYTEYAVEGFELNATDYLLKPFPFERFYKAVNKALIAYNSKPEKSEKQYILLKSDKKLYRIDVSEINYLEAKGDYVKVHYSDKSILVHDTFSNILDMIGDAGIFRMHKSFAVALSKIKHVEGKSVKVKDKLLPVGQTYKSDFLKVLGSDC